MREKKRKKEKETEDEKKNEHKNLRRLGNVIKKITGQVEDPQKTLKQMKR